MIYRVAGDGGMDGFGAGERREGLRMVRFDSKVDDNIYYDGIRWSEMLRSIRLYNTRFTVSIIL